MDPEADAFLDDLTHIGPQEIVVAGCLLKRGSRVRLHPRAGGDLLDMALADRAAVIEGIEYDDRGTAHVAVTLEDDPGRDLAGTRHPTRRYLFTPQEIEPVGDSSISRRVLVAGIGNVFLGDDGFGSAVAQRLAVLELPPGVDVVDFGIRGLDLAYALGQSYEAAILVDAVAAGGAPGSLHLIEPDPGADHGTPFDSHRMDPAAVLRLARRLGGLPPRVFLVGCEPAAVAAGESLFMRLSVPVAAAVEKAAEIVLTLTHSLLAGRRLGADGAPAGNDCMRKEL